MNPKLVGYAIGLLWRRRWKSGAIAAIFAALVWLVGSALLTASALERGLVETVDALPELTVQRLRAGRQLPLPADWAAVIAQLPGVERAQERVWGNHFDATSGATFTVLGIDPFLEPHRDGLARAVAQADLEQVESGEGLIAGSAVAAVAGADERDAARIVFLKPDGSHRAVRVVGRFHDDTSLLSGDLVLVSVPLARELLGLGPEQATDVVARVPNPAEIPTVTRKIKAAFPDARIVTRAQIATSYRSLFDFGAGWFLALSLLALAAFAILVFERASGLSVEERREIAVLRAVGWTVRDVLQAKLWEGLLIAAVAVLAGLAAALAYVFLLDAPLLIDLFAGYARLRPALHLPPRLELGPLAGLVLVAVPIYLGATLLPAWRVALADPDENLR